MSTLTKYQKRLVRELQEIYDILSLEKPVRLRNKAHRLYLAAGGLLAVWSLYHFVNGYRVNWNFDRVPIGASKAEVVRLLGTPWKVDKCGELFSGGPPNPACAEEYLYKTPSPRGYLTTILLNLI